MRNRSFVLNVLIVTAVTANFMAAGSAAAADKLKLLIIDGQNNHNWRATTPVLEGFLSKSGRYEVTVATTPTNGNAPADAWKAFNPDFSKYDVVLSNYNGQMWPDGVKANFEKYVSNGGAVCIVHAANNAFTDWAEFNRMIGLGWRGASFGDRITFSDDGKVVRTPKGQGPGAGHGPQHDFSIIVRQPEHPVMEGLPREWMHAKDELYHGQRGPAADMHILATALAAKGGTNAYEPMVWWIPYGKGKVFTTVMGHSDYSMTCVGFQTVVLRGCEWAATGKISFKVPDTFPGVEKVSVSDPRK